MERSARRAPAAGDFIGCVIGGLYLYLFSFSVLGFGACIGVGVLTCELLRMPNLLKLTGITIAVTIILSLRVHELPAFMNAGLRFGEAVIGIATGLVLASAKRIRVGGP